MKALLFTLTLTALSANAAPMRTINSFSVVRTGGGEFTTVIARAATGEIAGTVTSCSFKNLSPSEQLTTRFVVKGTDALAAAAILDDNALIAETVVLEPIMPTGSWASMELNYTFKDFRSQPQTKALKIANPLVLVNDVPSDVLSNLEATARKSAATLCK